MSQFLLIVAAYFVGYWWGKRVGIALAMSRMQSIFLDLQRIQNSFKQWNEDQL